MNTLKTPLLIMLLMVFVCLIVNCSYSQDTNLEFTKKEVFDDYKVVYFVLNNSITEIEFKEIYNKMYDDENIIGISLESKISCKAKLKLDVTPEYIQQYLISSGFDFAYESVENKLTDTDLNHGRAKPTHYPEKKISDDPHADEENFQKAIEFWKQRYPNELE